VATERVSIRRWCPRSGGRSLDQFAGGAGCAAPRRCTSCAGLGTPGDPSSLPPKLARVLALSWPRNCHQPPAGRFAQARVFPQARKRGPQRPADETRGPAGPEARCRPRAAPPQHQARPRESGVELQPQVSADHLGARSSLRQPNRPVAAAQPHRVSVTVSRVAGTRPRLRSGGQETPPHLFAEAHRHAVGVRDEAWPVEHVPDVQLRDSQRGAVPSTPAAAPAALRRQARRFLAAGPWAHVWQSPLHAAFPPFGPRSAAARSV